MLIDFALCTKLVELTHETPVRKIYHIGAHEGEEASIYAQNMVSNIIWFEANMTLIEKLKKQIDSFKMTQHIIPCALWMKIPILIFMSPITLKAHLFLSLVSIQTTTQVLLLRGLRKLKLTDLIH